MGTTVTSWLIQNVACFREQGIEKIIQRHDKRLKFGWNYVQNWWESSTIKSECHYNRKCNIASTYFLTDSRSTSQIEQAIYTHL
jgi:hypothetical protein